jgi:hypothetical protein
VSDTGATANRQAVIQEAVDRSEALDMARLAISNILIRLGSKQSTTRHQTGLPFIREAW